MIDYRISFSDNASGVYKILATNVTPYSYTTSVTLIPGKTYYFVVESRNSAGYSLMS